MGPIIHISIPTYYEFKGWKFEFSRTKPFGPWPVKNNFESRKKAGSKFYKAFDLFYNLPTKDQDQCEIFES